MSLPVLTAQDVEARLTWPALVEVLRAGHLGAAAQLSDQFLSRGADVMLSRAAWIDGQGVAVKTVTVLPENPARGLPSIHGALLLFDDATGQVEAVIDSALVTKWKTAADSVLGAKLLARVDAASLLIVGAGTVAESLVSAYRAVFDGLEVTLWNRTPARAEALAARLGCSVAPDLEAAVARADIVACATLSQIPVLEGAWLRPGQHVDLIGAFTETMREVDDAALLRARLFVDSRETVLGHIGEFKDPLARGVIAPSDVLGDLRDLVAGRVGRRASDEITLFKNGGGAHLDLMTGRWILETWRAAQA